MKRSTDLVDATNQSDYARGDVTYLSRADGFANAAVALAAALILLEAYAVKKYRKK